MLDRTDWAEEFNRRFDHHLDELKWLFCELYHNNMTAFDQLTQTLYQCYEERKESLRARDRQRETDPSWYQRNDLLGMMMYTDCFAGTLKGVQEKLDYVEECGVSCLHLMPLLDSPEGESDGGYAVSDYRKVNPKLGTMEDLADLADDCHDRGINLCMDFVMNHTSHKHEWALRARAGEEEYRQRYFFYDNWDIPNLYEQTVPQVFSTTAPGNFTWLDDCKQVVMTFFYPYQWDLNYGNPVVFTEMTANMLNLANHGIDILRIDAVPYIWKQLGTDCRNLPQVHNLVRMLRMICEIVCPGVLLLGEVVMEPVKVAPYFGSTEKPECHMLYNATMMCTAWSTVATRDVRLLRHQLDVMASLPRSYIWLNYIRCHDDIGWGLDYDFLRQFGMQEIPHKRFITDYLMGKVPWSHGRGESYNDDPVTQDARLCGTTASLCGIEAGLYEGNEQTTQQGVACDLMLHAFVLTQSGIPMLYSGDEIGTLNDYTYHDDPHKREDSRYIHRGNFDWSKAEEREDTSTVTGQIFQGLRQLEQIRAEHDVFSADAAFWTVWSGSDHVLAVVRRKGPEKLLALFNFSEHALELYADDWGTYRDLISGEQVTPDKIWMEPYAFRWLLLKEE
jgi:amylosucrase